MTENEAIELLTEGHLGFHGGYPYDWTWIGDVLVIAELDDGKDRARTSLRIIQRARFDAAITAVNEQVGEMKAAGEYDEYDDAHLASEIFEEALAEVVHR